MEKRLPRSKSVRKSIAGTAIPVVSETKMARSTITPEENDPSWDSLGSTRIVDNSANAGSAADLSAAANYTEISPSRVLGKNVLTLGDYQLQQKLGEGAMGAVYKARQVTFNGEKLDEPRTVALKVLFPHISKNPKLVKRMQREADVMFELDHPNIVQAFAFGEEEGCHYIAMEYVHGQSMQKWLTQIGRIPVADAVKITLDCARALAYAHERGMIHRDIKPDNILLAKIGTVKVADLGMVKIDDEEMSLTQTGHAVGTPWFMPLEQAKNAKDIDGRSDIYALGCSLYAFLTGQPPFTGRTIVEVMDAKKRGTFPPARQSNSEVPERLDLLLIKMTAVDLKYRYQNCADLIKDLESLSLASTTLSFLQEKPTINKEQEDQAVAAMTATVSSKLTKSKAEPAPLKTALDPNEWYVQTKGGGKSGTRKYTTAQLQSMLADGKIQPNTQISRDPTEGFRALATFKEFQGAVLGKVMKKGADKNTARSRGMLDQIKQQDRKREEKERLENSQERALSPTTEYWLGLFLKVLPIGVGVASFVGALFFLMAADKSWAAIGGLTALCLASVIVSLVSIWKS